MNSRFIASPFPWQLDEADWTSIRWKKKNFRPEFVNSRRYRHLTLCPGNLSFESSRTNNPYNFRFLVLFLPFLPFFPPPLFSFRFLFYPSIPSISFSFPDDVLFITVVVVFFFCRRSQRFTNGDFMRINFIGQGSRRICIFREGCVATHRRTMIPYFPSTVRIVSFFLYSSSPFFRPQIIACAWRCYTTFLNFLSFPSPPLPFLSFFSFFPSSSIALDREDWYLHCFVGRKIGIRVGNFCSRCKYTANVSRFARSSDPRKWLDRVSGG